MSIEDKLAIIKQYKLKKEAIEALENQFIEMNNSSRQDTSTTNNNLLRLLINIEIIQLKDTLASSLKSEIDFGEKMTELSEKAAKLMEKVGGDFRKDDPR